MATRMKMDLLTAVEQIVELAKDSQLSKEFFRKADKYIKYVSTKLELTKEQSVMMALFINHSDDNHIRISELSEDVKCTTTRIIRYMNDIDVLETKEFIRCCRERRGRCHHQQTHGGGTVCRQQDGELHAEHHPSGNGKP